MIDAVPLIDRLPVGYLPVGHEIVERNIKANCARGLPQIPRAGAHARRAVVCAGGPSLASALHHLRKAGAILAVNKASAFLLDAGIVPRFIALADPQDNLLDQFAIDRRCTYLVSSKCAPAVFDALADCTVLIWHEFKTEPHLGWIKRHYPQPVFSLYGSTATLRSVGLLYVMGFRRVDFYGWDGSYEDGKHHAYEQPEDDALETIRVSVCEREFVTRGDYAREAQEMTDVLGNFRSLWKRGLADEMRLEIHGDGLIPHYWREWRRHEV